MEKIETAYLELKRMDELADGNSPVHRLHPLSKLLVTIAYVFITASFDKYELSGLAVMVLFPLIMYQFSGISVKTCFVRMRYILILLMAVGIFNPLFDRTPMLTAGGITVTGGVISMLTLMLKGICCVLMSFLLTATTRMDALCAALRRVHVPAELVTLFLMTYRYIALLMEETSVMVTAYKLRAPGERGIKFSAWGSFTGGLLLRSMDRASEIYDSMILRGFDGDFHYAALKKAVIPDFIFSVAAIGLFIFFKNFNAAEMLGAMITGGGL